MVNQLANLVNQISILVAKIVFYFAPYLADYLGTYRLNFQILLERLIFDPNMVVLFTYIFSLNGIFLNWGVIFMSNGYAIFAADYGKWEFNTIICGLIV